MPVDQPNAIEPAPGTVGPVFVTGAGGFLGRHIASALVQAGRRVIGFGRRASDAQAGLGVLEPSAFVAGDLSRTDLARAVKTHGAPAVLVHAAGGSSVGASIADPEGDLARNVGSLKESLAFLAEHAPGARLVYLSSAAIYGAGASGPIAETARPDPVSPYGRHKQMAEALIGEASAAWGVDAAIVRFFSAYGPGLRKQLLWELAGRLMARPAEVALSGTGEEARDFLYADDAAALTLALAGLPRQAEPLIVNGGSGQAVTVRQVAETLRDALGLDTPIRFSGESRPGDPKRLTADISRARALGFEPRVSLEDGMTRAALWLKGALG
jgi:UDP-glucose 4-epimerase